LASASVSFWIWSCMLVVVGSALRRAHFTLFACKL